MKHLTIALFLIAGLFAAVRLLAAETASAAEPGRPTIREVARALPRCEQEDSTDCVWRANKRGNGHGTSFINLGGTVYHFGPVH